MNNTQVQQFSFFAQHGYRYKLYIDDLPSATVVKDPKTGDLVPDYLDGIPIGEFDRETRKLKIYNHLQIEVKVHLSSTKPVEKRIVGFNVRPMSRAYDDKNTLRCDHNSYYEPFYLEPNQDFMWSYCYRTVVSKSDSEILTPSFNVSG